MSAAPDAPSNLSLDVTAASLADGSARETLLAITRSNTRDANVELVDAAYALANRAHDGQMRRSGDPYFIHPVRVSMTIAAMGLDSCSVAAALLHDAVEDCDDISSLDVAEQLGRDVAAIVDGVTKIGKVPYLSRQEQQAESFRKMLLAMAKDLRVLFVKLADRLDNMRTLDAMPKDKQVRIGRETMEIYAPLAHLLGIEWLRRELQDLSFSYVEPAGFAQAQGTLGDLFDARPDFINEAVMRLSRVFSRDVADDREGVERDLVLGEAVVDIRSKFRTPYTLHCLTQEYAARNDGNAMQLEAADVVTYHVITKDRPSCYLALGLLHRRFSPNHETFRDYIAVPRKNGYQALHTHLVDAADGMRLEVQIRSLDMDEVARRGCLARDTNYKPAWLRDMVDWERDVADPNEFIQAVKGELYADEVVVYTPGGDLLALPRGACPIDFAFAIHTDVGMHCSGARINGQVVPLRYRLRHGDKIEILTDEAQRPRAEWLSLCATSKAKARVRQYLRKEERRRVTDLGRSLVEQELSSWGFSLERYEESGSIAEQGEALGLPHDACNLDGVYGAVGVGQVSAREVVALIEPEVSLARGGRAEPIWSRVFRRARKETGVAGQGRLGRPIVIDRRHISGRSGGPVLERASCCQPVPGDRIVGFLDPATGLRVHREDCPVAAGEVAGVRVAVAWEDDLRWSSPVTLQVSTTNSVGLLAEMSRAFSQSEVNIRQANCRTSPDGRAAVNTFEAVVDCRDQLEGLSEALRAIRGVLDVRRVGAG